MWDSPLPVRSVPVRTRPDIIYMNSWVIFCSGMVSAAAWLRGIPVAMSIQDIYPESLSQQKRIAKQSLLFRIRVSSIAGSHIPQRRSL